MTINIAFSNILTAFDDKTIGTKILDKERFLALLKEAIANHDHNQDQVPGQHFIMLGPEALPLVSCSVGRRTQDPRDYVIRNYRGNVSLRRETEVTGCATVVYTREAYLNDPDVRGDPDRLRETEESIGDATHVIVAVLTFGGPEGSPPLSPYRFVHNLAGGNNAFDLKAIVDRKVNQGVYGSTPSSTDTKAQLEALDQLLARRDDRFLQSIRDQVARGRTLSEKQKKAVRRNFYRARMRDKADLFR